VAPIRVIVADDHPIYRSGLAEAIREHPGLELVAECADGAEAAAAGETARDDA
jgi:DNA-binding NarL/FixJ family response regulator